MPDPIEAAWAAGFFDGEGNVGYLARRRRIQLQVAQADRRVLDRFVAAIGEGRVYGPYKYKAQRKPYYMVSVQTLPRVENAVSVLWDYLSPVKREQVERAIAEYRESACV